MTPLDRDVERELDRLDRRIMAVEHTPLRLTTIEVELTGVKEDLADIKRQFAERAKERARERNDQSRERKSDRRWMIATVLSAAGLVIAAMAILLPALGGS